MSEEAPEAVIPNPPEVINETPQETDHSSEDTVLEESADSDSRPSSIDGDTAHSHISGKFVSFLDPGYNLEWARVKDTEPYRTNYLNKLDNYPTHLPVICSDKKDWVVPLLGDTTVEHYYFAKLRYDVLGVPVGKQICHTLLHPTFLQEIQYPVKSDSQKPIVRDRTAVRPFIKYFVYQKKAAGLLKKFNSEGLSQVQGYRCKRILKALRKDSTRISYCKSEYRAWDLDEPVEKSQYPVKNEIRTLSELQAEREVELQYYSQWSNNRELTYHAVLNETEDPDYAYERAYSVDSWIDVRKSVPVLPNPCIPYTEWLFPTNTAPL
jgi:hypothetical protein